MMKSEIREGMKIDWDAPIEMDDGVVLRGDVFRPLADGKYPVILSYGPYAKGLSMQEGYKSQWLRIVKAAPDVLEGSSNKHQNWELFDPEKWAPDGYICLRAALAARRAIWKHGHRASRKTSPPASTGPACSPGRTARSACTASPTIR